MTSAVLIHPSTEPATKLPDYGIGAGPVYLSGQNSWYAGAQEALFLVDPRVTGTVTIIGHLTGGTANPSFGGASSVQVPAGSTGSSWRVWNGLLSFPDAGCYSFDISQPGTTSHVVLYVHAGPPPPG